jgi:hypothetical protein
VLPDELALIRSEAVHESIVRANINPIVVNYRTGPEAASFFEVPTETTVSFELPNRLTCCLVECVNKPVFSCGVNPSVGDGGSGVGIRSDTRLPDRGSIGNLQTIKIALLSPHINTVINDGETSFDRTEALRLVYKCAVLKIQ